MQVNGGAKVATSEHSDGMTGWNLVQIGHQNHSWSAAKIRDMFSDEHSHGVSRMCFHVPRRLTMTEWVARKAENIQRDIRDIECNDSQSIHNLVLEFGKSVAILRKVCLLGQSSECSVGFDD